MWALITVHCGHNWGYYTLLTQLPNYMKSVLGYDISQVIFYSIKGPLNDATDTFLQIPIKFQIPL